MKEKEKKYIRLIEWSKKMKLFILGVASLIWFLMRVIPKPSRAAYPCQRVAFPIASGFVLWIISSTGLFLIYKKAISIIRIKKGLIPLYLVLGVFILVLSFVFKPHKFLLAGETEVKEQFIPNEPANEPIGIPRGINPGRVVWVHDTSATSWSGTSGYWWDERNNDQEVIDQMISKSLLWLTEANNDSAAWSSIFRHFNLSKGRGETFYQEGEKIAIKLNMNNNTSHGTYDNHINTSPQIALGWVKQLVEHAGVPETCITLYDVSRQISSSVTTPIWNRYPGVKFVDLDGGAGINKYIKDNNNQVHWSEDLLFETGGGNPTYLPTVLSEATYVINIGSLKAHDLAGVTLCAKNHFGSFISSSPDYPDYTAPRAAGVHPYVAVHYFAYWEMSARDAGTYNTLVDLMGHKDLGEKTLLFIVDALYGAQRQQDKMELKNKWQMPPFNGDWTSSIFVSQDGVAIESVGLDFLRSEPTISEVYGEVDNYLHEAALANNPPSGIFYSPNGDGLRLNSLGVHEHWNNITEKKYSVNLKSGNGIELIQASDAAVDPHISVSSGIYTEPFEVEIHTEEENALIQYYICSDGSSFIEEDYSSPLLISQNTILKARAFVDGKIGSGMISKEYRLKVSQPVFSLDPGTYEEKINLSIQCSTVGAQIYYTLDGSEPTSKSLQYNQPVSIEENTNIKAIAIKENWDSSSLLSGEYKITTTNLRNFYFSEHCKLYPNPFNESILLNIDAIAAKELFVSIHNISGRLVLSNHINSLGNENIQHKILTKEIPNGIYICTVAGGTKIIHREMILKKK